MTHMSLFHKDIKFKQLQLLVLILKRFWATKTTWIKSGRYCGCDERKLYTTIQPLRPVELFASSSRQIDTCGLWDFYLKSDTGGWENLWLHIHNIPRCGWCGNRTWTYTSCRFGWKLFHLHITTSPHMLLGLPQYKTKKLMWSTVTLMSNRTLAGPISSLMLVVGATLIRNVKSKHTNVSSIIVSDSAQKMILNHLGVKKIIIHVGTNDILVIRFVTSDV